MDGSSLPSPNFSSPNGGGSQDFLGFSSTPIPGKNFKPKWGKKNRNQNWNRFGSMNDQEAGQNHQNSPHHQNTPHHQNMPHHLNNQYQNSNSPRPPYQNSPRPQYQNSPHHRGHFHMRGTPRQYTPSPRGRGSYQNTPNGGRGSYGGRGSFNNSPYTSGRGGAQNSSNDCGGYFSPAMLRNPWADLEWARDRKKENEGSVAGEGGSEDNNGENEENTVMSDSMIPQVGESLLERNEEITSVEGDLETADAAGSEGGEQ